MNLTGAHTRAIATTLVLSIFCAVIAAPIALLLVRSVWIDGPVSLHAYSATLLSSRQLLLFARSVALAGIVAALSTALGAGIAHCSQNTSPRVKALFLFLLTLPALIPQHIMAIAWVDMLGRNGYLSRFVQFTMPGAPQTPTPFTFWGAAFILALTLFPIPMLATAAALRRFDARYIEAARVAGQSHRVLFSILLPLTLPATLTGAALVFAISLTSFSVPSLLQVNTYSVEIHASSMTYEYGVAVAQALPMLVLVALIFTGWSRYVRPRRAWLTGARRAAVPNATAPVVAVSLFIMVASAVAALVIPLATLFIRSLPLATYASVWSTANDEIINGIVVSALAATAAVALAVAATVIIRKQAVRHATQLVGITAFVLPGPLLALGFIALWNRAGLFGLVYDSILILVLACVARFLAIADIMTSAGYARLHPRIEEAAAVAGVTWWRSLASITLPLLLPYLIATWVLVFIFSLGEVDAAVLLCPPGASTFAVRLFSLMHYGPDAFVAALSILTALGVAVVAVLGIAGFKLVSLRMNVDA